MGSTVSRFVFTPVIGVFKYGYEIQYYSNTAFDLPIFVIFLNVQTNNAMA